GACVGRLTGVGAEGPSLRPAPASGAGNAPVDATGCPADSPVSGHLHDPFDPRPAPPALLCTFAQPRSSPSCKGVSKISRSRCKASAEVVGSISRRRLETCQPNLHTALVPRVRFELTTP